MKEEYIKVSGKDLEKLNEVIEISRKLKINFDRDLMVSVAINTFVDIIENEGLKGTFGSYFERGGNIL